MRNNWVFIWKRRCVISQSLTDHSFYDQSAVGLLETTGCIMFMLVNRSLNSSAVSMAFSSCFLTQQIHVWSDSLQLDLTIASRNWIVGSCCLDLTITGRAYLEFNCGELLLLDGERCEDPITLLKLIWSSCVFFVHGIYFRADLAAVKWRFDSSAGVTVRWCTFPFVLWDVHHLARTQRLAKTSIEMSTNFRGNCHESDWLAVVGCLWTFRKVSTRWKSPFEYPCALWVYKQIASLEGRIRFCGHC